MSHNLSRIYLTLLCLSASASWASFGQSSSTVNGKDNQSVGTNNGTMNQYNFTVAPPLKRELRHAARHDFGSDNGWLATVLPAHDPQSSNKCDVAPDALTLSFGQQVMVASCSKDECGIIGDSNKNAPNPDLLSLQRKGNSLLIHAVVLDEAGKVIALMDGNKTHANPNNAFQWLRPDSHTIDVFDQYNRNVFHLRFANPTTVTVTGLFYNSTGRSVDITDEKVTLKFGRSSAVYSGGTCMKDNGIALRF